MTGPVSGPHDTYEDALVRADQHRAPFGDDVVQHLADEYYGFLGCDDCGWTTPLPFEDPDYDGMGDDDA